MEPRDVDARICEMVRSCKKRLGGIPSAELAERVGVSRDYLRARLRFMERTGRLPGDVAKKLPDRKGPVPDEEIERAWRTEATTTAVARTVGLSRAGVLQRVAKLRVKGVELRERPHGALTPEQRLALIDQRIQGRKARREAAAAAAAAELAVLAAGKGSDSDSPVSDSDAGDSLLLAPASS